MREIKEIKEEVKEMVRKLLELPDPLPDECATCWNNDNPYICQKCIEYAHDGRS